MSSKYKEFWILMAEQDDIVLTPPSRIKNADKYIHVIDYATYLELKGKLDKLLEAVKCDRNDPCEHVIEVLSEIEREV